MNNEGNMYHASICIPPRHWCYEPTDNIMADRAEMNLLMHACSFFPKPKVLELGTYKGGTTNNMAKIVSALGGHLVTVDVKSCPSTLPEVQRGECLPESVVGCDIEDKYRSCITQLLVDPAEDYSYMLAEFAPYDVIFYDGDHSYEGIRRDLEMLKPMRNEDCIEMLHDVWWDVTPPPVDGPLRVMQEQPKSYILNFTHIGVLRTGSMLKLLGVPNVAL